MANAGKIKLTGRRGRMRAQDNDEEEVRPFRPRQYKYLFLIVCEDEQTERLYFEKLLAEAPTVPVYVKPVGAGRDWLGVTERAITERTELAAEFGREVDEVWLVFDKDDADRDPAKTARFEAAIALAEQQHFELAFSNEVFELWLLLHLIDVEAATPLHRTDVYRLLGEALRQHTEFANFQYHHKTTSENKATPAEDTLAAVRKAGSEEMANTRAINLLAAHAGQPLILTNPSTRVHLLVATLRSLIAFHDPQLAV